MNVATNRVLTEADCWRMSSTGSTPSSTKETAPIWMPTIFEAAGAAVEFRAAAASAALCRNVLRSMKEWYRAGVDVSPPACCRGFE